AYVALGYNKPGFVDMEFDIDVDGTPRDVTVVAQDPASGLYEKASREQVTTARFISACAQGKPVVAEGFAYRMSWFVGRAEGAPAIWVTP
ncbi:MAG: energy transducer TonB, partial [Pseudomonadota bacterium]